ncbi:MAG TPA: FAD-dependent oxidoreductase [Clostridia bacterium]|nr:FAD-dependent oxidoreductase [Clostridia bacterium]
MKRYLVIGGGSAGVAATQAILERDKEARILLFSKENVLPYSRPMLTKMPLKFINPAGYPLHDRAWYDARNVELRLGEEIVSLDSAAHEARTANEVISYDKCVYAAGGYNFIPPFRGVEKGGVCDIRSVRDMERLKQLAYGKKEAVVIGGGAIGLETACELVRYGLKATVLEALPMLMPRQLDADTAEALRLQLSGHLEVHVGVTIEEIEGEGEATAVRLADGRRFPCALVVISCGVRADIAIAKAAGIQCNRAVVVNERMETSTPDVYACGDCAEYNGLNYMLWSEAWAQGLAAGANAAGGSETFGEADTTLVINTPFVSLFAYGDTGKGPGPYRVEARSESIAGTYAVNPTFAQATERLFYLNDILVGATILGNLTHMQALKKQIREAKSHA